MVLISFTKISLVDKLIEIAFRRKQDASFKAVNYGENIFAAAGSALPWGGRGRKFKSCHSDQKSGVVRFPIFLIL